MTSSEVRDKLVEALVLDLIGPIDDPARENERLDQSPSRWYLTGFLVPRNRPSMDLPKDKDEDEDDNDNEDDDLFASDDDPVDEPTADTLPIDDSDKAAVVVSSKRRVLPSSMGLSLLVPLSCRILKVIVRWGDYQPEYAPEDGETTSEAEPFALEAPSSGGKRKKQRKIVAWSRQQHEQPVALSRRPVRASSGEGRCRF